MDYLFVKNETLQKFFKTQYWRGIAILEQIKQLLECRRSLLIELSICFLLL